MASKLAIRARIEAEFGSIPQKWWEDLDAQAYVEQAVRKLGFAHLRERVRELIDLGAWVPGSRAGEAAYRNTPVQPLTEMGTRHDREGIEAKVMRARGAIFSKYLAKTAGRTAAVQAFRDEYLAGHAVSSEVGVRLLQSPAVRYMRRSDFEKLGVPVLEHESRVLEMRQEAKGGNTHVWITDLEIKIQNRRLVFRSECEAPAMGALFRNLPRLSLPRNPREDFTIRVFPTSVMDDLRRATEGVIAEFPWEQAQATWFILTGSVPRVFPIEYRLERRDRSHHSRTLLTMVVEPWLPAELLKHAYTTVQRRYLGRQRQPGPINTEVFEFVVDRMGDGGRGPDWDALVLEWNKTKGSKRQYKRWRFIRDFERARDLLVFFGRDREAQPERVTISV